MINAVAWAGIVIGAVALVLAWVAFRRPVPAVQWEESAQSDSFELWNVGPGDVVILKAIAGSADAEEWPAGDAPQGVVDLDERLGGWRDPSCAGTVMSPSHRFLVKVGTNCDLSITYRASGFLGALSRGRVHIPGDL
jgi:hypothetical protein